MLHPPSSIITSGSSERRHFAKGGCLLVQGHCCPWVGKSRRAVCFRFQRLSLLLFRGLVFASLHGTSRRTTPLPPSCPIQLRAIIVITVLQWSSKPLPLCPFITRSVKIPALDEPSSSPSWTSSRAAKRRK